MNSTTSPCLQPKRVSSFKADLARAVAEFAEEIGVPYESDVDLDLAGGFVADHAAGDHGDDADRDSSPGPSVA